MATTIHNSSLNQSRNLLNAFKVCHIKAPDTQLAQYTNKHEDAIHREISILSRLGRLPLADERRSMLRHSYFEADRQFEHVLELVRGRMELAGEQLAIDSTLVATLTRLSTAPSTMKKQFNDLLFHGFPVDPKKLWVQRIYAARELLREAVKLDSDDLKSKIQSFTRTIVFEPQYRQAGISVLSYFGEILQSKYPDTEVLVRIEQTGSTVTLVVESAAGEIERIERELTQYGLVVEGRLPPSALLPDPVDAMRLQHKLDMAQLEIRHTRELLHTQRSASDAALDSMKNEIAFIRGFLDKTQYEAARNAEALRTLGAHANKLTAESLERVIAIISNPTQGMIEELQSELKSARDNSPGFLDHINELLVKGSIQGAAGN